MSDRRFPTRGSKPDVRLSNFPVISCFLAGFQKSNWKLGQAKCVELVLVRSGNVRIFVLVLKSRDYKENSRNVQRRRCVLQKYTVQIGYTCVKGETPTSYLGNFSLKLFMTWGDEHAPQCIITCGQDLPQGATDLVYAAYEDTSARNTISTVYTMHKQFSCLAQYSVSYACVFFLCICSANLSCPIWSHFGANTYVPPKHYAIIQCTTVSRLCNDVIPLAIK